ncbi:thymidylate synthase [Pyrobaculum sp.]|uniref:thymidylate synthase n=1 Tax=Pyrobaculum sp. TaxID=2004705 RepID=UPI00315E3ED8
MSNLLLVLLWLSPDKISREVKSKVASVGTAYTADAVNQVVKALYETYTHVDTVLVFGPDLNGAGELIVEALRGACNDALRVPCEYVKSLNAAVVDLRWRSEAELKAAVEALYKPREVPARPRREVPMAMPSRRLPHPAPHVIYDVDLEALRAKAVDYILTYGLETEDVLYNVLVLQRGPGGAYTAGPCDLAEGWPCGLDKADVLLATPAYVKKSDLEKISVNPSIFLRTAYDPHGNFVLADRLYHYDRRGVLLRALELTEANLRREAQKLLPDHAFYLGKEYAAKRLLKEKYVQDSWEGNT